MKPGSVRRYLGTLKLILDYCGVDPNPARDGRVKLPKMPHEDVNPPSAGDVEAMVRTSPSVTDWRWRRSPRPECASASCTPSCGATWTRQGQGSG